ncbi:MAG: hypothetical protein Kow0047_12170 [Anaerolineae bacterium]
MPIYEYRCRSCGRKFDRWYATYASAETEEGLACPNCRSDDVQRLFSRVAIMGERENGADEAQEESTAPEKPPVFGRKELNEIMEQRKSWGID